jgi:xanthine/uracil/vitamin C permease (AzgA family)
MILKAQIIVKKHPTPLREILGTLVPAGVLTWALGMLTASYMGHAKVDSAFISSLVTSVLAVYGITRKDDAIKPQPPRIRTTPIKKKPTKPGAPPTP